MDKILKNSNRLFKYIMDNYDFYDKINFFLTKVQKFK